jgi:hypothetical protein
MLGVAVLAGACSGGSHAARPPTRVLPACRYFTLDDARALVGADVTVQAPRPDICGYNVRRSEGQTLPPSVTLVIRRGQLDAEFALHSHPTTATSVGQSNMQSFQDLTPAVLVAGLGDRATWQGHPTFGALQVQRRDVLADILVQAVPDPEGHARAVATVVVRRLHS